MMGQRSKALLFTACIGLYACQRPAAVRPSTDLAKNDTTSQNTVQSQQPLDCESVFRILLTECTAEFATSPSTSVYKVEPLLLFHRRDKDAPTLCIDGWKPRYDCFNGMNFAHFERVFLRGIDSGYYRRQIESTKGYVQVGMSLTCGDISGISFYDYVCIYR